MSSVLVMPRFSIPSLVMAVIEIGVSCNDPSLRSAVTSTSSKACADAVDTHAGIDSSDIANGNIFILPVDE